MPCSRRELMGINIFLNRQVNEFYYLVSFIWIDEKNEKDIRRRITKAAKSAFNKKRTLLTPRNIFRRAQENYFCKNSNYTLANPGPFWKEESPNCGLLNFGAIWKCWNYLEWLKSEIQMYSKKKWKKKR